MKKIVNIIVCVLIFVNCSQKGIEISGIPEEFYGEWIDELDGDKIVISDSMEWYDMEHLYGEGNYSIHKLKFFQREKDRPIIFRTSGDYPFEIVVIPKYDNINEVEINKVKLYLEFYHPEFSNYLVLKVDKRDKDDISLDRVYYRSSDDLSSYN